MIPEEIEEQARINIKVMFRQCGIRYEGDNQMVFNHDDLLAWFMSGCNKKDYNPYDTI